MGKLYLLLTHLPCCREVGGGSVVVSLGERCSAGDAVQGSVEERRVSALSACPHRPPPAARRLDPVAPADSRHDILSRRRAAHACTWTRPIARRLFVFSAAGFLKQYSLLYCWLDENKVCSPIKEVGGRLKQDLDKDF